MDFTSNLISSEDVIFVGEFVKKETKNNLISFNWKIDSTTKKNKNGRIYFFIEIDESGNKKIIKIGKSSDKNGLSGTIGFYINTLSGTPGITRYAVHNLIYEKLIQNKKILVYCRFSDSIEIKVKGLFETYNTLIPLDMSYIEELCLKDFFEKNQTYPEWNFQENNKKIPLDLLESYGIFIQNKKIERDK